MKTPKTKKPTRNRIVIYSNLHYMLHGGSWEACPEKGSRTYKNGVNEALV